MPFVNVPGRFYTDPIVWHEDPIYRVEAPAGTYNHTLDLGSSVTLIDHFGSAHGNSQLTEAIGGPFPDSAATNCAWSKVIIGHNYEAFWGESCPPGDDGPGNTGGVNGSTFSTSTPPADIFGAQIASAAASICGFVLRPWQLHSYDNPWMDDEDLEDEYGAVQSAAFAALPGSGWFTEWEQFYPTFVGLEFAPDETIAGAIGTRTEGVTWYHEPLAGWGFAGVNPDLSGDWQRGSIPSGTALTHYAGGLADWEPFPEEWLPTQDVATVFDSGGFIQPENDEEDLASLIPLSLACDTLYQNGLYPGDNASGGRQNQWLVFRVAWQAPRFRFYRESSGAPPRRVIGRPGDSVLGAARTLGVNTVQSGSRVIGGIL